MLLGFWPRCSALRRLKCSLLTALGFNNFSFVSASVAFVFLIAVFLARIYSLLLLAHSFTPQLLDWPEQQSADWCPTPGLYCCATPFVVFFDSLRFLAAASRRLLFSYFELFWLPQKEETRSFIYYVFSLFVSGIFWYAGHCNSNIAHIKVSFLSSACWYFFLKSCTAMVFSLALLTLSNCEEFRNVITGMYNFPAVAADCFPSVLGLLGRTPRVSGIHSFCCNAVRFCVHCVLFGAFHRDLVRVARNPRNCSTSLFQSFSPLYCNCFWDLLLNCVLY